jgi:hypothetical protein
MKFDCAFLPAPMEVDIVAEDLITPMPVETMGSHKMQ